MAERFSKALREGSEPQDVRRERLRSLKEYHRKLERFGTAGQDEEAEQHLLEIEDLAQHLAAIEREVKSGSRQLTKVTSVVEALDSLVELAENAADQDPKLDELARQIAEIRQQEPRANVLVYTEYTDSQLAARKFLEARGFKNILTMSGDDDDAARGKVTASFRTRDDLILVSTDAAAEGLNLHQRCHHLIHLELPFNPNRLEQRNGRIDRYGQNYEPIVSYLYLKDTFEERILLRLIANNVEKLKLPGKALYSAMLNEAGWALPSQEVSEDGAPPKPSWPAPADGVPPSQPASSKSLLCCGFFMKILPAALMSPV